MSEASVVKYYFTKYFFLAFGLLQIIIGVIIYLRQGEYVKGQFAAYFFFTLGLVFVSLFLTLATKIKRVGIKKKKVAVVGKYKTQCYDWREIKSINFIPAFNLFCMKIRGKKGKVYFLAPKESEAVYGLFHPGSSMLMRKEKD